MNTDLSFPVTASQIGPAGANPAREARTRVFYLKPSDLLALEPSVENENAILKVKTPQNPVTKITLVETPDEFLAAQALSQGATASAVFARAYAALTPTSSGTASDQNTAERYYNQVSSINGGSVRLPDPFVRRLVVIENLTTGAINVRGRGTTSPINGSTAAYSLPGLKRVHFVAPTAATAGTTAGWKTALDGNAVV